ncbi:hypothetical protein [Piscirickettsia litoralis]|uniref:Uncharacterized protein n=1 Tax=Piscirickettsia litoralis TaxID=1891921 RepID=A0ABX2ZXY1_9GAMM|nr:hypothetical protein [Piscirickettsia litoralis]ODN41456.1 hypothetical protein BGC07_15145 [Piscirickettsia litoralis]
MKAINQAIKYQTCKRSSVERKIKISTLKASLLKSNIVTPKQRNEFLRTIEKHTNDSKHGNDIKDLHTLGVLHLSSRANETRQEFLKELEKKAETGKTNPLIVLRQRSTINPRLTITAPTLFHANAQKNEQGRAEPKATYSL